MCHNKKKHGNITVLIDACRDRVENKKGIQQYSDKYIIDYLKCAKGTGVIFSCAVGEYSLDCFNSKQISVFTSYLLDALKGQREALDGEFLTFNSIYEYISRELLQASKKYTQINQHPQKKFEGSDIVYAVLDEEKIESAKAKHHIFSFEEEVKVALDELDFQINSVIIEKYITVDNIRYGECHSESNIVDVCKQLSRMGYLFWNWEATIHDLFH